jgi:uncharacterized lipoprotein NlpE involved in copper resistance
MLYNFIVLLVFIFIMGSCSNQPRDISASAPEANVLPYGHNARNALDYYGIYKGVLPCADCEGIETEIELSSENLFVKKTKYLGKEGDNIFEEKGIFEWNEDGNIITLKGIEPPNMYFAGENTITHLDLQGQKVTGALQELYILRK